MGCEHRTESLLPHLLHSCVQVIDNVAANHSAKKQKSAQKAWVAEQAPAKASPKESVLLSEKKVSSSQRRISPRQRATDKVSAIKPGQEVLGRRVKVFWKADQAWYKGSLCEYSAASGRHLCEYDDGDREWIDLAAETYELDEGGHSHATSLLVGGGPLGVLSWVVLLRVRADSTCLIPVSSGAQRAKHFCCHCL